MIDRMWAGVYHGKDDVRIEQIPIPQINSGEVLVRVAVCGVCGTDLKKIHHGLVPGPRVFGHETSGTIVDLGSGVTGWCIGDRVAVMHHVPCNLATCRYCKHGDYAQCPTYKVTGVTAGFEPAGGGYAEFVRVLPHCTQHGMVKIPEGNTFEEATFVEPLNTVVKGIQRSGLIPDDVIVVYGQGPIGLLITQTAKHSGARVVGVDPLQYRRDFAKHLGADMAVEPSNVSDALFKLGAKDGADIAVVAVADASVIKDAIRNVRKGGKILLFAQTRMNDLFEVDAGEVCVNEKTIIGSYSSDIASQEAVANMIWRGDYSVDDLITHRFSLNQLNEALLTASRPVAGVLKVLVSVP